MADLENLSERLVLRPHEAELCGPARTLHVFERCEDDGEHVVAGPRIPPHNKTTCAQHCGGRQHLQNGRHFFGGMYFFDDEGRDKVNSVSHRSQPFTCHPKP